MQSDDHIRCGPGPTIAVAGLAPIRRASSDQPYRKTSVQARISDLQQESPSRTFRGCARSSSPRAPLPSGSRVALGWFDNLEDVAERDAVATTLVDEEELLRACDRMRIPRRHQLGPSAPARPAWAAPDPGHGTARAASRAGFHECGANCARTCASTCCSSIEETRAIPTGTTTSPQRPNSTVRSIRASSSESPT